jgi:hypothetical protein
MSHKLEKGEKCKDTHSKIRRKKGFLWTSGETVRDTFFRIIYSKSITDKYFKNNIMKVNYKIVKINWKKNKIRENERNNKKKKVQKVRWEGGAIDKGSSVVEKKRKKREFLTKGIFWMRNKQTSKQKKERKRPGSHYRL